MNRFVARIVARGYDLQGSNVIQWRDSSMNTHFAPAERAEESKLQVEIHIASSDPIMTGFLEYAIR